jgi:RNA polymerase sigma-70 factor (ECF subfamily)
MGITATSTKAEQARGDLEGARRGDAVAFERLVGPHRGELIAHCYRMLGSLEDAEDAVQDTLVRAWRGLRGFEGRSSLRSWLYRIATNVCLNAIERRPRLALPVERAAAGDPREAPEPPLAERAWIEPLPDDIAASLDAGPSPEARYEQREAVELAFIASLQHLPARQRAVLLLRDVLGFSPAEIAKTLEASPAAVYSALQRARTAVNDGMPEQSQQRTLRSLGDRAVRELVDRYVLAWERADVDALVSMLAEEVTLAMPPSPSWFSGREDVGAFLARYPLSHPERWRVIPIRANAQLGFAFYRLVQGAWLPYAISVSSVGDGGRLTSLVSFHSPEWFPRFGLPGQLDS